MAWAAARVAAWVAARARARAEVRAAAVRAVEEAGEVGEGGGEKMLRAATSAK